LVDASGRLISFQQKENDTQCELIIYDPSADTWQEIVLPEVIPQDSTVCLADESSVIAFATGDAIYLYNIDAAGESCSSVQLPVSSRYVWKMKFFDHDSAIIVQTKGESSYFIDLVTGDYEETNVIAGYGITEIIDLNGCYGIRTSQGPSYFIDASTHQIIADSTQDLFGYNPVRNELLFNDSQDRCWAYPYLTFSEIMELAKEYID